MERRKPQGLKTYGRVKYVSSKYKRAFSSSPLMSWNDLINRSDSFDRLTKTCGSEVDKKAVSEKHDESTNENVTNVIKRSRGLSQWRKSNANGTKSKVSENRQPMSHENLSNERIPYTAFHRCNKPYPPCSPIEVPRERDQLVKPILKDLEERKEKNAPVNKTAAFSFASHDPGRFKSVACSKDVIKFEENANFWATSTPEKHSGIISAITLQSFCFDAESNIFSMSKGTEKQSSLPHLSNLENDFSRMVICDSSSKICAGLHRSQEYLETDAARLASMKLQSSECSAEMGLLSISEYKTNQVSLMASTQNLMHRNDHQYSKNESEATTVPIVSDSKNDSEASTEPIVSDSKNESEATTLPIDTSLTSAASHLQLSMPQNYSSLQQSLMFLCEQPEILNFETCFPTRLKKCSKVGEGTYGEVFAVTINTQLLILKVVPFEGDFEVNGATQKKFQDIQNEVVLSRELSDLRIEERCSTFIQLVNTYCIKGEYPKPLLRAWQQYDNNVGSENENPKVFDADQLYMFFVYENGGCDLEKFKFSNAVQVKSAFLQICCALAVAEEVLKFEHRDLHWGNILVSKTDSPVFSYKLLSNKPIQIKSEGISVRIIDYSICRMQKGKGDVIYTDLSNDDDQALFTGQGDYQFEVYRMMKSLNNNSWKEYNPKTNIYWLGYILVKLCPIVKRSRGNRDERKKVLELLGEFQQLIPSFGSSLEFVSKCSSMWD